MGRFDDKMSQEDSLAEIGKEFLRRLQGNMQWFCPTCERIVPVFNNLQNFVQPAATATPSPTPTTQEETTTDSSRRNGRALLQTTTTTAPGIVSGTYSVMLIYKTNTTNQTVSLSDIQRAVFSPQVGSEPINIFVDPASMGKLLDTLNNNQFIIGTLQVMQSPSSPVSQ